MATIADRVARVTAMLGGRTDIASRVENWIRDAYVDLGASYDFEELEQTHNTDVTSGNNEYAYPTLFLNNNTEQWEVRAIKTLTLRGNGNNRVVPLTRRHITWLDRFPPQNGDPAIYCPYHNNVVIFPTPASDWILRWRVWLKPRIVQTDSNNNIFMNSTPLMMPDDWLEILDYAAAMRGHTELLERDKAAEVMQLLFGAADPRTGRRVPGLIDQKMLKRHAESNQNDYGMRPIKRGYTR